MFGEGNENVSFASGFVTLRAASQTVSAIRGLIVAPRPKDLPVESPTCVSCQLGQILFLIFTEPADSRYF